MGDWDEEVLPATLPAHDLDKCDDVGVLPAALLPQD